MERQLELIEELSRCVESLSVQPSWDEIGQPPFSAHGNEGWLAISSVESSTCFIRLRIVQEVCLGQTVNVFCDSCFTRLDSFCALCQRKMSDAWTLSNLGFNEINISRIMNGSFHVSIILSALDSVRDQQVSKPIDKVYGLLFLMPRNVRERVEVH